MSDTMPVQIQATGEATGFLPARGNQGKPITVIGTNYVRAGFALGKGPSLKRLSSVVESNP